MNKLEESILEGLYEVCESCKGSGIIEHFCICKKCRGNGKCLSEFGIELISFVNRYVKPGMEE